MQGLAHDSASLLKYRQADIFTLDVGALDKFFSCHTAAGVSVEKPANNLTCIYRQSVVICSVLAALDLLVKVLLRDTSERKSTCQHDVEKHS